MTDSAFSDQELAIRTQLDYQGVTDEASIQRAIARITGKLSEHKYEEVKSHLFGTTIIFPDIIDDTENNKIYRDYQNFITNGQYSVRRREQQRQAVTRLQNFIQLTRSGGQLTPELLERLQDVRNVVPEDTFKEIKEDTYDNFKKGLSKDDLEKLETECPICYCDFEDDEKVKKLKCGHIFHVDCIKEWLTKYNHTCSVCNSSAGKHIPKT